MFWYELFSDCEKKLKMLWGSKGFSFVILFVDTHVYPTWLQSFLLTHVTAVLFTYSCDCSPFYLLMWLQSFLLTHVIAALFTYSCDYSPFYLLMWLQSFLLTHVTAVLFTYSCHTCDFSAYSLMWLSRWDSWLFKTSTIGKDCLSFSLSCIPFNSNPNSHSNPNS